MNPLPSQILNVTSNAMKALKITILLLSFWTSSYGQDGSNIRYFKIIGVDSSLIGWYVHFDFFDRSFRGQSIDTITIIIDNRPTRFIEVRKDNGYNNWFSQQSLQSIDKLEGQIIKIPKFKLDSIYPGLICGYYPIRGHAAPIFYKDQFDKGVDEFFKTPYRKIEGYGLFD